MDLWGSGPLICEPVTHPVLPHQRCFNWELCLPCFGTDSLLVSLVILYMDFWMA